MFNAPHLLPALTYFMFNELRHWMNIKIGKRQVVAEAKRKDGEEKIPRGKYFRFIKNVEKIN